jgi:hypothetical protein
VSEESRQPSETEVEGHLVPQDPERIALGADRLALGAERTGHGRLAAATPEDEGPEVEGHRLNLGPERLNLDPERLAQ